MAYKLASWTEKLLQELTAGRSCCLVLLAETRGSTPREAGTVMLAGLGAGLGAGSPGLLAGTVGGGELEYQLLAEAGRLLAEQPDSFARTRRTYPLGPALGQCCGGSVEAVLEIWPPAQLSALQALLADRPGWLAHGAKDNSLPAALARDVPRPPVASQPYIRRVPFYLYGAGHVGRAVMAITGDLPMDRYWIDTEESRFPADVDASITRVIASDPAHIARYAESQALHLVMSYSHALDQAICHTVLKQDDFFQLGLIGSATKRARFESRLGAAGISKQQLARLVCPIGLAEIPGKDPAFLALSVAGQIAVWLAKQEACS
jgi:xanthine dehydrogenase accessory factor